MQNYLRYNRYKALKSVNVTGRPTPHYKRYALHTPFRGCNV